MGRARIWFLVVIVALWASLASPSRAQDPDPQLGMRPYDSYSGGQIDSVSVSSASLTVDIPILSYPQRGSLKLDFALHYEDRGAYATETCYMGGNCMWTWVPRGSGFEIVDLDNSLVYSLNFIDQNHGYEAETAIDAEGSSHRMAAVGSSQESLDATAIRYDFSTNTVTDPKGIRTINPACGTQVEGGARANIGCESPSREDPNGNLITFSSTTGWVDTTGRAIPLPTATTNFAGCTGPLTIISATNWTLPGPSGGTDTFKLCYVSVPTTIGYGSGSYIENATQLQSVILPNSTAWTMTYSSAGDLAKITFPSGGTLSYTWGNSCVSPPPEAVNPEIVTRTLNANDGAGNLTWTYTCSGGLTTITDPLGNDSVHTLTALGGGSGYTNTLYETQAQYYQGSHTTGTLLKTVSTGYSYYRFSPCTPDVLCEIALNVVPTSVTTSWPGGTASQVTSGYDTGNGNTFQSPDPLITGSFPLSYGRKIDQKEYDNANPGPGPLLRETQTQYKAFIGSNYFANNFLSIPSSVVVYDGGGTQKASTTYGYDGSSLQASGITTQHSSSPPNGTYRANLTSVSRWLNTTGSNITNSTVYYDTGTRYHAFDPNSNQTSYSYMCAGSYQQSVTNVINSTTTLTTTFSYDCPTGLLLSVSDPNNQPTTYTYEPMWRVSTISYPDGGGTTYTYNDTLPSITVSKKILGTRLATYTDVLDGIRRLKTHEITSDGQGTDYVGTKYDGVGHVHSVTNPYRTTSDPTYGLTTYTYDGLGRTTLSSEADGSQASTSYAGTCRTVTDEASKKRTLCNDGLGRLQSVVEDPGGLGYTTGYTYDTLNDLLTVTQGTESRAFTYDSLSRLVTSVNPESGQITYTYDNNGNVLTRKAPSPNQPITGTATATTKYTYDSINRILSKTYNDLYAPNALINPSIGYSYDVSAGWNNGSGGTIAQNYPKGRLTQETATLGTDTYYQAIFGYDPLGRVALNDQCTPLITGCAPTTYSVAYTYDLLGDLSTYGNGGSEIFIQTYDNVGRPSTLSSSLSDAYHPGTLAVVKQNFPSGAQELVSLGFQGSGTANLQEVHFYNKRFQVCRYNLNNNTITPPIVFTTCGDNLQYNTKEDWELTYNEGSADNGNIVVNTRNYDGIVYNRTYHYDGVNRVMSMSDADTSVPCQGMTWSYDQWGNRKTQSASKGSCQTWSQTYTNGHNQMDGWSYDPAGNLLNDKISSYYYDDDNRIIQVNGSLDVNNHIPPCTGPTSATACYLYDPQGRRIEKIYGGQTDYVYNTSGQVLAEKNAQGDVVDYLYFGGRLIAQYENSTTYFIHANHVASTLMTTDINGNPQCVLDYMPFGESSTCATTTHQFAGKQRDAETGNPANGLDNFGARYNSSRMGRFMSPDWDARPTPVPNASLSYPQSLNLYSYTQNNPMKFNDPTGHRPCTVDGEQHGSFWCFAHGLGLVQTRMEELESLLESTQAELDSFPGMTPDQILAFKSQVGAAMSIMGGAIGGMAIAK